MMKPPYIPESHKQYDLLPYSREHGGEVFSYPAELSAIDEMLSDAEGAATEDGRRVSLLIPYGRGSYDEYYEEIEAYAEKYKDINPELSSALLDLEATIRRMNVEENWSVVRYVGKELGSAYGLTPGRCYYWPSSIEHPEYEGVIDDEEFTSYLYPCDADCWEVLEDPTGMAERALAGEADTVHAWTTELFDGDSEDLAKILRESGGQGNQAIDVIQAERTTD